MLTYKQKCPECDGPLSHEGDKGEVICYNCGLVLDDNIIKHEVPFRDMEDGGGRDGVGAPITHTDVSLGLQTNVGNYSDFKQLSSKQRRKFERLKIQNFRTSSAIERNLKIALPEIKRVTSVLNLSNRIEEEACRIYREASFKGLVKGRAIENVAAASVYAACRSFDSPMSLKDIERAQGLLMKKEIGKTYRLLSRTLNLRMAPQTPYDYIPRICGKLNLSQKAQTDALRLMTDSEDGQFLSGRSPMSVASSVVYVSSLINREKRTQRMVAGASGITEVTLRNRYKELVQILRLSPKDIKKMRHSRRYPEVGG